MLLDIRHNALTKDIIGCAMRVHSTLGHGFPEMIYQRSMAVELEATGFLFSREIHLPGYYKGVEVGARRADFLVEKTVLIELKATAALDKSHYAQINFGEPSLTFKRFLKTHGSDRLQ